MTKEEQELKNNIEQMAKKAQPKSNAEQAADVNGKIKQDHMYLVNMHQMAMMAVLQPELAKLNVASPEQLKSVNISISKQTTAALEALASSLKIYNKAMNDTVFLKN